MRRRFITGITAIAAAACSLLGGNAAPAEAAGGCAPVALSQPFQPWLDPSWYWRVPNGGFERSARQWSLDGDARVVAGNEPFYVHNDADDSSLRLGENGSATSTPVCVAVQDPTLRFFVRNTGSPLSLLQVAVQFTDPAGDVRTVPIGLVAAGAEWQPTLPFPVAANLLSLLDGSTEVAFRFTPIGIGGDWTIDDVYVDPFKTK